MNETFEVIAETRRDAGKGASRRLRREGKVPAIMYGAGGDPVSLCLSHNEMYHHLTHEAFYSHILSVKVDGKVQRAVLKAVQRHPAKPIIMHIDFQRVSETDKLHMHIPLHFINEATAPGVKAGGLVSHVMNNVEVVCLAKDLPEYIEVDLSGLNMNEALHLSDLKLPKGVEIPALAHGADHDLPVVSIHAPKAGGEVETAAPVAPAAPPAAAEKKPE